MKSLFIYGGFLFLCVSFFSCSDNDKNNSNNFATGIVELPGLRNGANDVFVTHYTTFKGQKVTSFSMEYDKSKKHSRWVAFRFDNQTKLQEATRGDNFIPDPSLDMEYQRTQVDFGKKGYDRGHLCASADRLYQQEANDQTFYYTNMSPNGTILIQVFGWHWKGKYSHGGVAVQLPIPCM